MEKILRECTRCKFQAKSTEDLNLFVSDKKKSKFYFTKATCKNCNAEVARQKRSGTYEYPDKSTKCKDCGLKPKDDTERESLFVKEKSMKSGYANLCRKCASARTMKHQKEKPDMLKKRVRKYNISKHGLTLEKYEEILEKQNNSCEICKTDISKFKRNLYVDHDHSCCSGQFSCGKCIRGLLCHNCNFMIGLSKDNQDTLKYAIIYLSKGVYH